MSEDSRNEQITVRILRNGELELLDDDWSKTTPEERLEAVWTLIKLCMAWNNFNQCTQTSKKLLLAFNVTV